MISQPRNKFIDRFRTQIVKSTVQYSQEKSQRYLYSNRSGQLKSNYGQKSMAKVENHQIIVQKLEKHIRYLQKKLKDAEQQNEKLNNYLSSCQGKIIQKEGQCQNLIHQICNLQQNIKKITWENEIIKSNYQNAILQQKMQKLSLQVNEKKQTYAKIQLKHHHHKKGKFSSAFLPSSFNSPHKYQGRKPKQYQPIIQQYEITNLKQTAVLPKNTVNNCLLNEWKEKKEENQKLVKEAKDLKAKNIILNEQIAKCKQRLEEQLSLKQQLNCSNAQLANKNNILVQQYNLLIDKLKQHQQKMIDISIALQEKSQLSLNDILHLFTNSMQTPPHKVNLAYVQEVINLSLVVSLKIQRQMQTEQINPENKQIGKIQRLESTIQTLAKRLEEKQIQIEQYRQSYTNQVTDLANLMRKQIDHIDQMDYSHEETNAQRNQEKQEDLSNQIARLEEKETAYTVKQLETVELIDNTLQ